MNQTNMPKKFTQQNVSSPQKEYITELEARELIAAILANYEGIVRFRNIETTIVSISDFTSAQHNHSGASGGGQLNGSNCFSTVVSVPNGGTGANTLTGVLVGNGAGAFTATVPLAGTKVYYVADSSGGAVTRKLTFVGGILTAET